MNSTDADHSEGRCLHQDERDPFCGDPACEHCRVGLAQLQAEIDGFWEWDANGELPDPPEILETSIAEPPDPEALAIVERYAACDQSLSDLRQALSQILGSRFRQNEKMRSISLSSVSTEPTVRITWWHVENALSKKRCKLISDQDLIDWATTVISNSVYFWDGKDRDLISEWISHLSLDFSPGDLLPSTSP